MTFLAILGRLPALSLAELESLYGAAQVTPVGSAAVIVEAGSIDLTHLGGTAKLGAVVSHLERFEWNEIIDKLAELSALLPGGKTPIGISVYNAKASPKEVFKKALLLKKRLAGRAVRVVPNQASALNSAQVHHNQLITKGAEWLIVRDGSGCIIGQTTSVQDIEAYGRRDYGRSGRSAKVGMLPPKLAQILINLAAPPPGCVVLDPFCGTGVIPQEARLMGFEAYGSDIDAGLSEMSRRNLAEQNLSARLETGDATTHHWAPPIDAVVTEGYLGTPLTTDPDRATLESLKTEISRLNLAFLKNLHAQITPKTPVVMCQPAWRQASRYERLGILDQLTDLGYTVTQFQHAQQPDLIYFRPGQIVARELLVLRRN